MPISFNQLLQKLYEELDLNQKKEVDSWKAPHHSFSDHVFSPDHDHRLAIPLNDHTIYEPHPVVKKHLETHGYEVHDYKKGLVRDKYGRQVSIGKILNKTKASPETIKKFTNDKSRESSQNDNLHVVISRHPHDVAGMSTKQGWTSCMDMDFTGNHHRLRHEVEHGTHAAYLTHKDDIHIKSPIARIALKSYESKSGHKVLRPEAKSYGHGGDNFSHSVRQFTEDKFPLNDGEIYRKNKYVYDDDRSNVLFNKNKPTMDKLVEDKDRNVRYAVAQHGHKEHQDKLVKDEDGDVRLAVAQHGHKEHLDKLVNDDYRNVRHAVAQRGHKEHLDKLVEDKDWKVRLAVAQHGHKEHLDKLVKDKDGDVRLAVAQHGHKEHLDKLVNDDDWNVHRAVAQHVHKEHQEQG